jgi:hypothetical protein
VYQKIKREITIKEPACVVWFGLQDLVQRFCQSSDEDIVILSVRDG